MRIEPHLTDNTILAELGERLRRCRLDLNRTQAEVAHEAGIGKATLERLEAGKAAQLSSLLRVLRVLGLVDRLETLVPAPLPSPIALLAAEGAPRQRASGTRQPATAPAAGWGWGEDP